MIKKVPEDASDLFLESGTTLLGPWPLPVDLLFFFTMVSQVGSIGFGLVICFVWLQVLVCLESHFGHLCDYD